VLHHFGFTYSSPQSTPLPTGHSLSAPPSDESVEPSGLYPELVGCLMYLMTCTRPDLAYPLSLLARTSGMGLVLVGRARVVLTGHAHASWVDDLATQRSSSCEAKIYTGAMAAQELRWLTYLLTDLGEAPRSPPVLYPPPLALCPPPLFHGCTVPQLPTFTASLATFASNVTAANVTTSSRSRGRSGRRGGQGAGGGGGGGGGGVTSGGGESAGVGGVPHAAPSDSPAAAGGATAAAAVASSARAAAASTAAAAAAASSEAGLTDTLRAAYRFDGPAPNWLPFLHSHGAALWGMSASQLLDLLGTPYSMYAVLDSSVSDSVYSSVFSLRASVAEVPVASVGTCVDTSPRAAPEDASLSFTLDSGASHCFFRDHMMLTPLSAPVSVALADPTLGPVTACYTTTLPCPAVPSGFLTGFHVPSFSRNLVGVRPLVDSHVGVWIEPSRDTRTCVDHDTYAPLATFHAEPGSSLYRLHTSPQERQQQQQRQQQQLPPTPVTAPRQVPASHEVATSHQVAASGRVPASVLVAASCLCRSLAHPTVPYHHRLGHPSIPCLRTMASQCLGLGLPRVLPSVLPSLAPPCAPCIEGRLCATPHSSSLCPATEPFETLYLDVWGPALRPGLERESFFLVVVDDYSRYTTVFPLAKKSEVTSTLVRWLLTTADTRGRRLSCLHSDRGFFDSRDVRFDEPVPYYTQYPCRSLPVPPPPLFLTPSPPPVPQVQPSPPCPAPSGVSHATPPPPPPSVAPQVLSPSPYADPGGTTPGGVGVGAESVPPRGSGAGGAGVGAEPKSAGGSSLQGAGVCRAVTGGATSGGATTGGAGAPTMGFVESGTGCVAAGGAGSGGGATDPSESGPGATIASDTNPPPHPYPTRHQTRVCRAREEQLELEQEERELEQQQPPQQKQQKQQQQEQPQP
ncbi:unnamed protein product, partial [Closterium sp. NIES-53]